MENDIVCDCGCGQTPKPGHRFVLAHRNRKRAIWAEVKPPTWDGECFRWNGTHDSAGYGRFKQKPVHRIIWELFNEPIPEGLTIDHVYDNGCRHRDCFRLSHMEVVTKSENSKRVPINRERQARTHCKQGHEYTEENTLVSVRKNGVVTRCCRECSRIYQANRRLTVLGQTPRADAGTKPRTYRKPYSEWNRKSGNDRDTVVSVD